MTNNSNSGTIYTQSDETYHANTSSSSLPPPRIVLPSRQSSFSSVDNSERKGLTPQASYPNLASSIKSSKKKASSSRRRSLESDPGLVASFDERSVNNKPFANEKRNKEFHALFKSVPLDDNLIEDYGCALQKEILLQGRIYITQHHLCFNANIFGWITNLVIAFTDIVEIEKRTTAIFIPNAILISTNQSKHFFASFLSREQAYDQMVTIWRQAQQRVSSSIISTNSITMKESSDDQDSDDLGETDDNMSFTEWDEKDHDNNKMKRTYAVDNILALSPPPSTQPKGRQASQASLPIPAHTTHDDADAARRRAISEAGPRPNAESIMQSSAEEPLPPPPSSKSDTAKNIMPPRTSLTTPPVALAQQVHQQTQCQCGGTLDEHYPSTVMDQTYFCTMETLYNLLYQSGFVTKYLTEVEKSTDVVIHPWRKGDGCPYIRDASYVKYLGSAIGPKSTRCILKDELLHVDFTNYVTQQTSTQTPDVPHGGNFCVKTRVCLTWAGQGQVRMLVTVLVPFTKTSWLKSTIEKASIDGQINYYKGLDAAIRKYTESRQEEAAHGKSHRKRKGKDHSKRHGRKTTDGTPSNPPIPTSTKISDTSSHGIAGFLSQILGDGIDMVNGLISASPPTLAQCTVICLVLMVITNLYIAAKMINMGQQLPQRNSLRHTTTTFSSSPLEKWRLDHRQDVDSMWQWLEQIEKNPWISSSHQEYHQQQQQQQKPAQRFLSEKRHRSNQHFAELEKMVMHTEQSVDHVHRLVKQQRQQLLQHYSP